MSGTLLSVFKDTFQICKERITGYFFLKAVGKHITVMGSARIDPENPAYKLGTKVGHTVAVNGFSILTGGGPGMMQAVNEGAFKHNRQSFGVSIKIPHEQKSNPFLKKNLLCKQFCSRKFLLIHNATAIIFLPGGYGTFDELFEVLTLIKTGRLAPKPLILIGKDFWEPIMDNIKMITTKYQTISDAELNLIQLIDSEHDLEPLIQK